MRKKLLSLLFLGISSTFSYETYFQESVVCYLKQQKEECERGLSKHGRNLFNNVEGIGWWVASCESTDPAAFLISVVHEQLCERQSTISD